jgi:transcriptional regulator of acetoin/glycerol metabolism
MQLQPTSPPTSAEQRGQQIALARQALLQDRSGQAGMLAARWIERSWARCLSQGKRPEQDVAFDLLPAQIIRRTEEANHALIQAARPVLETLGQAIASTRYFAILTNAQGVVVDVNGPINRRDRRADLISRIGVDLSESSVGTTAIGAALTELQPVWLHRGEHFFEANCAYSCAGAPLFGPDGQCVGMLDVTGVDTEERPELMHLVVQSARRIENALIQTRPHALLLRINWPGASLGEASDGLVGLDSDGWLVGANPAARQLLPTLQLLAPGAPAGSPPRHLHSSDLFALPYEALFNAARKTGLYGPQIVDIPLWSGLRLQASPLLSDPSDKSLTNNKLPLRELQTALIRQAVAQAHGNVQQAARALSISRATVYRKLGKKSQPR